MQFCTADYVLCVVTIVAAILGLFGGFSGALGFCAGVVASGVAVKFGWPVATGGHISTPWGAALAMLAAALLVFGIARAIVKRIVKGLLAQPADAIFGFLIAGATGVGISLAAIFVANRLMGMQVQSAVYSLVMGFVG